ncbi:MAG: 16S rRNA (cytidine1402-2'-O)-methyltransferase [Verrucomicrobiales bacterium]|jgi:16S rRNA (cytidine1402-2'-O)-methyltransferase
MSSDLSATAATGVLYLIGTPIGNLGDISQRAIECLRAVDIVACEDTRHSGRLLHAHDIEARKVSLHQHNEASRGAQLIENLLAGESVGVISDAGMPLVSDPGARFLHRCREAGIRYEVIPGPSAVLAALVGSGLPSDRFFFGGFLPTKKGQRRRELEASLATDWSSIYFESPHRIMGTLEMLHEIEPDRLVCVARELTKKFEEFRRGTVVEVLDHYRERTVKGEISLVIAGKVLPKWMRGKEATI